MPATAPMTDTATTAGKHVPAEMEYAAPALTLQKRHWTPVFPLVASGTAPDTARRQHWHDRCWPIRRGADNCGQAAPIARLGGECATIVPRLLRT